MEIVGSVAVIVAFGVGVFVYDIYSRRQLEEKRFRDASDLIAGALAAPGCGVCYGKGRLPDGTFCRCLRIHPAK